MRIAVTGDQGMLGSELCTQWREEVVRLDLPAWDLTDGPAIEEYLFQQRPEAVIHAAAFTAVDLAEREIGRCRQLNVGTVAMLVDVCRRLDCPLVQMSTDYVFGADTSRRAPYRETDATGPLNVYGQSKLDAEHHVSTWRKHFIVRTCGLFGQPGPRTAAPNFVDRMLELGAQRQQVTVVDDQQCSPSYVPHVAGAILRLLPTTSYGVYHVVNQGGATWYDLAVEIFDQSDMEVAVDRISTARHGAAASRPAYSVLDAAKYAALTGAPLPPWREALAVYLSQRERRYRR